MKRLIALCAFALSSSVFASTQNSPPNDVDVSGWKKRESQYCYNNGIKEVRQIFSYINGHLDRFVYRISFDDTIIGETHYVSFEKAGKEFVFMVNYVKSQNTWISYSRDEEREMMTAYAKLHQKTFPDGTYKIPCPTQ